MVSTTVPVPTPSPQTIQIQLPAEVFRLPVLSSNSAIDVSTSLMLVAFAIVVKVTIDYLKPAK
ncbi:hypothetical protein ACN4EK_24490 [Pantanalinema rosaneae CENA516]|uniref:hypothetical protein n=1 Tax=Pantanalinema rosaneae TaxID=1620701 RepID=UPI003D6F6F7E